jgi:hypothetical protein
LFLALALAACGAEPSAKAAAPTLTYFTMTG